jgi:hypothetical protein
MSRRKYCLDGQIFGKLTVIRMEKGKNLCRCECGNEKLILSCDLIRGKYVTCGCEKHTISNIPYDDRFKKKLYSRIRIDANGCWNWLGSKTKEGYGTVAYRGRAKKATRMSWVMTYGEIPDDLLVCHKCDNPSCINPQHFFLGTDKDNTHDSIAKGRKPGFPVGQDRPQSKLNDEKVKMIKILIQNGVSVRKIARDYGMGATTIRHIKTGRCWKHVKIEEDECHR